MDNLLLGKTVSYTDQYDPSLLCPIPRVEQRGKLVYSTFNGVDIWTAFEISWLNEKGKPQVAIAEIEIPAESPHLVESKSFKLYLNSFNQTTFKDQYQVAETIGRDLSRCCGSQIAVTLKNLEPTTLGRFGGTCLDTLDVEVNTYSPTPELLKCGSTKTKETVYTNLFKSNCLITGQPDWASVSIYYSGNQIDHASLLQYLVSFRNHCGFHEHCTEQIFSDLMQFCKCEQLQIFARFTRRGGIDINCYRTTDRSIPASTRLTRQ